MNALKRSLVFLLVALTSCANPNAGPLLSGTSSLGLPVCFEDPSKIPTFFASYYATRDLTTEEGKIDYLIERVRSSNRTYIRNGVETGSDVAARFLRWKLNRLRTYHKMTIETAEDFVHMVTSGSRMTGTPYAVIIPEAGGKFNFEDVLQNELNVLNACISKRKKEESV